jgi:hypothetical protein
MNLNIRHYSNPNAVGYLGWIEPEDKSWIVFIDLDGKAVFFGERDPDGGVR